MISPIHITRLWSVGLVTVLTMACAAAFYTAFGLPDAYAGLAPPLLGPRMAAPRPEPQDLAVEDFLPQQTRDMSPDQASAFNIAAPLERVNPLPAPFNPAWLTPADMQSATDCMADAIYHEAASEPFAGQLAVAQVILNRLRHPRFPKTVCAVVNQGSERATGCQFTFTCDGSRARTPDAPGLQRARIAAQAALHGAVSAQAGQATHYHTIWIVPVWAAEMRKVAILGHHVFYRPPAFYPGYALRPVPALFAEAADTAAAPDGPAPLSHGASTASPGPQAARAENMHAEKAALIPAAATRGLAINEAPWPGLATGTNQANPAPAPEGKPSAMATPAPETASRFRFGGERKRNGSLPISSK